MNQTMKPPMPKKPKSKMRQRISGRDGNSAMFDTAEQTKMNEMMKKRRDKDKRTGPKEPTDDDTMAMKKGGMACGGKTKKYAAGGKLEMVEKDGKKVPFYAADGKGKMKKGGKVSEAKKEAKKAVKKHEDKMHKKTKKMASGGKVRGAGMARKGVRPCKMR